MRCGCRFSLLMYRILALKLILITNSVVKNQPPALCHRPVLSAAVYDSVVVCDERMLGQIVGGIAYIGFLLVYIKLVLIAALSSLDFLQSYTLSFPVFPRQSSPPWHCSASGHVPLSRSRFTSLLTHAHQMLSLFTHPTPPSSLVWCWGSGTS